MNIDDFRYITTIAETGSFTNAAKQLFIAQPSLSQRVKHIEDSYGIIIFIRDSKKGIHLTEEGECFVRYARTILQAEEDLKKEISDMHNLSNSALRIGTSQLINSYLFDKLILLFHNQHPEVHFEFIERPSPVIQQLLAEGEIDIALCYLPVQNPELKYEVVFSDRFVVVPARGSELAQKLEQEATVGGYVDIHLLEDAPFAVGTPGTRLNTYVNTIFEKSHAKPDIQHYSKNFSTLYSIARAGIASTILYESFFDPEKAHEPYYYLNDGVDSDLSIAVAWRKNTYLRQTANDLIEIAKELAITEGNI